VHTNCFGAHTKAGGGFVRRVIHLVTPVCIIVILVSDDGGQY